MTTFIELKTDEELLEATRLYSTVAIVGCRECANISLAYSLNYPLATRDHQLGVCNWKPVAIREGLQHIESLLRSAGVQAYVEVETPCVLTPEKDVFMAANRTDIDAILSLACVAGKVGIEKTVGGGLPVISATHTVGLIQPWIAVDGSHLRVDPTLSTVVRFQGSVPEQVDLSQYWAAVNQGNDESDEE